ncbi:MAG: hypothetical protein INH43_25500 [Acidobacteriaceae bacterium]|nr:hypothetical protein [Acidobacteriaceae bacterium]
MADDFAVKAPGAAQSSALLSNAQLMPADPKKGYGTPYYAAYTNDGDMAGAVMVAEGQKVRLVDKLTGDVVYEGVGPAAAQVATATANAISKDKGRGAAWAIQKPTDEGGWVSMAEERYDPKKQGFWGKLADFALPVLGAILAPMTGGLSLGLTGALGTAVATGLGAAGGSMLGSATNRRDFDDALKRAAVTGLTAGALSGVTPVIGKAITKIPGPVGNAINTGYSAVMNPLNAGVNAVRGAAGNVGNVIQGGLNAAGELIVTPSVTSAITGGGIGALTGTAGVNALTGGTGADTLGNPVEGVDVTASNADAAAGGAAGGALGNLIDEVVVKPETPGEVEGAGGVVGTIGSDVVLNDTTIPKDVPDLDTSGPDYEDPTWQQKVLDWIKANPFDAASLGLTLAGGIGGAASGGGSGGGGIPPGFAAAGTRGSLSDAFRAKLPAPSGPFADLSARNVAMTPDQWKTYGTRSEESFYNNVPQRPSGILAPPKTGFKANVGPVVGRTLAGEVEPGLTVTNAPATAAGATPKSDGGFPIMRPRTALGTSAPAGASAQPVPGFNPSPGPSYSTTTGADMSRKPETNTPFITRVNALRDRRPRPTPAPSAEPERFAKGGFAVRGIGSGRDDKIPARLSDGEYVIDAETVALLGDGSSDAGAKRLDAFRANIRKHKGKKLVRGEFSVNAKKPEAYLKGGRV